MGWELVQNKQTLKSLAKKGHIIFPAKYGGNSCQIDDEGKKRTFKQYSQAYNMEIEYEIRYVDGSIYPLLFMLQPEYAYVQKYAYTY